MAMVQTNGIGCFRFYIHGHRRWVLAPKRGAVSDIDALDAACRFRRKYAATRRQPVWKQAIGRFGYESLAASAVDAHARAVPDFRPP